MPFFDESVVLRARLAIFPITCVFLFFACLRAYLIRLTCFCLVLCDLIAIFLAASACSLRFCSGSLLCRGHTDCERLLIAIYSAYAQGQPAESPYLANSPGGGQNAGLSTLNSLGLMSPRSNGLMSPGANGPQDNSPFSQQLP